MLSIFCFSLKVLNQGSSGENPQFPALIDSTELAHLEYCHYPLDGMLFPSRVTTSNDYVAGSINTPVAGENQCRAKILSSETTDVEDQALNHQPSSMQGCEK